MQFSSSNSHFLTCLFFFNLFTVSISDPRTSQANLHCGTSMPAPGSNYIPSFVKEMESLSQLVSTHHWGTKFFNSTTPIYGLAQCFDDLSHTDCLLCYAASRTKLPRCLPSTAAQIHLDGCFLRYDTYNFYNESVDSYLDKLNCSGVDETANLGFNRSVVFAIGNVTEMAVVHGGFAVVEMGGVFSLAQCWKTLSADGCRDCLEKAGRRVRDCGSKSDGRGMNAGCYLRYSTEKFYNEGDDTGHHDGIHGIWVIIAIVLAVAGCLMLSVFGAYAGYAQLSKIKKEHGSFHQLSMSINKASLYLKYEMLEKATDYFNPSRKIGQGGSGSVYLGTLPDGRTVAVKRLVFNTRQWVDEFFNEVNLIGEIEHKNLVKLLGCSIEGPESLLVYEYVPNKSLDQFLFDKDKVAALKWKQRFDIILGTAEGLAHLHGGSQMRIIHRDIKSSNILLDETFTPKIADFGLARCFAADKSHLSTGIAGTLGYMAPEYIVRGQLTEKADVYSFGVLVLEIVSGRKNNAYIEDFGSLIQTVWELHKINRLAEAVDSSLEGDYPEKEVTDVLQIGLLCTQASVPLRPSMAQVVWMLTTDKGREIPQPRQPPYLGSNARVQDNSIKSYSSNSLTSNAATRVEASYTSTETESSSILSHVGN